MDGLVLTSYPLHPPGKPNQLRTEHFPKLRKPALFVQGTKDPFATIQQLREALNLIPAKTVLLPIDAMTEAERSPLRVLERLTGRRLV